MDITPNNYEDDPKIVHIPLPDRTRNLIIDLLLKETNKTIITHDSHEHPLALVDIKTPSDNCRKCIRLIMERQYYRCTNGCHFFLHEWCTRYPAKVEDPRGTRHTLGRHIGLCDHCHNYCNALAYSSVTGINGRYYWTCIPCAITPWKIKHPSHPYHLLVRISYGWLSKTLKNYCRICLSGFTGEELVFSCRNRACHFHLHLGCAMLLPSTIRHKYDKHPMTLTYSPVKNHDGDYFCEVCEEELNPHSSFYHCRDCVPSMHVTCAPLLTPHSIIHKINFYVNHDNRKVYGIYYETKDHRHCLQISKATDDSPCIKCGQIFGNYSTIRKCDIILKCLICYPFAIHRSCLSDHPVEWLSDPTLTN